MCSTLPDSKPLIATSSAPGALREKGRVREMQPQDGPPRGGFPMIKYKRNLPKGGASSLVLAVGTVGLCAFGIYKMVQGNRERRRALFLAGFPSRVGAKAGSSCCAGCGSERSRTFGLLSSPSFPPSATSGMHLSPLAVLRGCTKVRPLDRRNVYMRQRANDKEAEIMQDVPSWDAGAGVYKNRYMKRMDPPGRFKADLYK